MMMLQFISPVVRIFKPIALLAMLKGCAGLGSPSQIWTHQGNPLQVQGEDGAGGSKCVLNLGEGRVMALFTKGNPRELAQAEATLSARLSACGLHTQSTISAEQVEHNGQMHHVLFMDRWADQVSLGRQIRDSKNASSRYGHTMLFGTKEGVHDLARWWAIFEHITSELVVLFSHGMLFGRDAFNLVIQDKETSLAVDGYQPPCLFDPQRQEVHLFFSDLAVLGWQDWAQNYKDSLVQIDQKTGEKMVNESKVKFYLDFLLENSYHAVCMAIKEEELEKIAPDPEVYRFRELDNIFKGKVKPVLFDAILKQVKEKLSS